MNSNNDQGQIHRMIQSMLNINSAIQIHLEGLRETVRSNNDINCSKTHLIIVGAEAATFDMDLLQLP